jgi:hypothetical protein
VSPSSSSSSCSPLLSVEGHHPIHPPDDAGWSLLAGTSVGAPLQLVHYSVMCGVIIGGEARQFDDRTELWQWAHLTSPRARLARATRPVSSRLHRARAARHRTPRPAGMRSRVSAPVVQCVRGLRDVTRRARAMSNGANRPVRERQAREVRERAVFSRIARDGSRQTSARSKRAVRWSSQQSETSCARSSTSSMRWVGISRRRSGREVRPRTSRTIRSGLVYRRALRAIDVGRPGSTACSRAVTRRPWLRPASRRHGTTRFNPRAVQRRRELVLLALAQDPKAEAADVAEFRTRSLAFARR